MHKIILKNLLRRVKLLIITALIGAGVLMGLLVFGEKYLPISIVENHVCPLGYSLKLNPSTRTDAAMHPGRSVTTLSPSCELNEREPVRVPAMVVVVWIYFLFFCAIFSCCVVGFPAAMKFWNSYVGKENTKTARRRRKVVFSFLQVSGAELILSALVVGIAVHLLNSLGISVSGPFQNIVENPLEWIFILFAGLLIPSFFVVNKITK